MTSPSSADLGAAASEQIAAAVERISLSVVTLYARAEQDLLVQLAKITARGFRDSAALAQVHMLAEMQETARRISNQLRAQTGPLALKVARAAIDQGDATARSMLQRAVAGDPRLAKLYLTRGIEGSGHGLLSANAIAVDLADRLNAAGYRITRFADDAYRAAVADASTRLVLGREALAPHGAQQIAWRELATKGITGYTDTRGRSWNLATYVETATRTTVQRAYNASHEARMTALGVRFFTVAHDGHPCPLCRPWEGAVLTTAETGHVATTNAISGRPITVTVKGTVDQARAAGFQHPNCRHVLVAYFPGVTKTTAPVEWTQADMDRYHATQELRRLERSVRRAKQQEDIAAALRDEHAYGHARSRANRYEQRIREHTARHGLVRRPRREQLHLANR